MKKFDKMNQYICDNNVKTKNVYKVLNERLLIFIDQFKLLKIIL